MIMKTQNELNAMKREYEELNKKLRELNAEELAQVNGGSGGNEGFVEGDWIKSDAIPHADPYSLNSYAYQVIAVDDIFLTVQEYVCPVGERTGRATKITHTLATFECEHTGRPFWI